MKPKSGAFPGPRCTRRSAISSNSHLVRAHVLVSGKVQGVGYRHNTLLQAQALGLGGWVRNLEDGRVEAVIEGPKELVAMLVDWCKGGPPGAAVDALELVEEVSVDSPAPKFEIRR